MHSNLSKDGRYYMGIDCGSVSMKIVIIDQNNQIRWASYRRNQGIIKTLKDLLLSFKHSDAYTVFECSNIQKVGITGSGREFVSIIVGGDLIESEVIAHYIAATTLYPNVRTIFDIGGEDSKLMTVDGNNLTSFVMNQDCGGGTGAMIESIAIRMGIPIDQVGDLALKSDKHIHIPSKCGVFAQSSVVSKLNHGISAENILMGVCKGFIGNYFAMLAKGKRLNPPYVFQGATAKNKALVKCFENELDHEIIVPEHPEYMGAIGVAILTKELPDTRTNFKGYMITDIDYSVCTYYGEGCSNKCEITQIYQGCNGNGKSLGTIGNRCQKCI